VRGCTVLHLAVHGQDHHRQRSNYSQLVISLPFIIRYHINSDFSTYMLRSQRET